MKRTHLHQHLAVASMLAAMILVVGCTAEQSLSVSDPDESSTTSAAPDPDAPVALVVTEDGLAGVRVGTSTALWVKKGAVAAPDGSAVYAVNAVEAGSPENDGFEVVRIDPTTGAETSVGRHQPGLSGIHVAAVESGGRHIALAAPGDGDSTLIMDVDPSTGGGRWKQVFEGRLEPEAFSRDHTRVFAARIYETYYHVHSLDVATGEQTPTFGPDKTIPPEEMYGDVVQAVLSPTGDQLATLYRDDTRPEHTAFVHLLSLDDGFTVCIDLHAPFGTGDPGTDTIVWNADGTVEIGHTADDPGQSMTASFRPADIWTGDPQPHYHADALPDREPPALPAGIAATPGFERFVALVP